MVEATISADASRLSREHRDFALPTLREPLALGNTEAGTVVGDHLHAIGLRNLRRELGRSVRRRLPDRKRVFELEDSGVSAQS